MIISKDPDDAYNDDLVTWIKIEAYVDGLKLDGHLDNKAWAVLMVEKAKEAINEKYQKALLSGTLKAPTPVVIDDVTKPYATILLSLRRNESLSIQGTIDDYVFSMEMLDAAKDALTEYHSQQKNSLIIPAKDMPQSKLIV